MPMTAAERQRKYREKIKNQAPDKYEENKRNHAVYMKNKRKHIGQLTVAEQNKRRKQWREAYQRKKNKIKNKPEKPKIRIRPVKRNDALLRDVAYLRNVVENLTRETSALKKDVYRQKIVIKKLKATLDQKDITTPFLTTANTPLSKAESIVKNIPPADKKRNKKKTLESNLLLEDPLAYI